MSDAPSVDQMIDALIDREGGYSDNPADKGGPTNFGITEAVARAHGYVGDMRYLPRSLAEQIYCLIYWVRPHFDAVSEISPRIAADLFDTGVNMGQEVAATFLQRSLSALNRCGRDYPDLVPDGAIGSATLNALRAFLRIRTPPLGEVVMLRALDALKGERYISLAEKRPADEAFLYGWLLNRVVEL